MFKKIVITSVIFAGCLSTAWAGSFYLGPALTYEALKAGRIHYQGLSPVLYIGYGDWVREWLYIAGEIFGSPKSIDINNEPKNGVSLKTKYTYGASLIPGINLDDMIMAYARLGFVSAKFQDLNERKGGSQMGLGLDGKIMDCWSIRAEYVYTMYSSVSGVGSLRSDEFTLAAIYQLDSLLS